MIPGIVRNQGERGAIYSDHILLLLVDNMGRRGNDSLYGEGWGPLGLRVLDAVVVNESEAWLLWHNGMEHRFITIIHSLSAIYQYRMNIMGTVLLRMNCKSFCPKLWLPGTFVFFMLISLLPSYGSERKRSCR